MRKHTVSYEMIGTDSESCRKFHNVSQIYLKILQKFQKLLRRVIVPLIVNANTAHHLYFSQGGPPSTLYRQQMSKPHDYSASSGTSRIRNATQEEDDRCFPNVASGAAHRRQPRTVLFQTPYPHAETVRWSGYWAKQVSSWTTQYRIVRAVRESTVSVATLYVKLPLVFNNVSSLKLQRVKWYIIIEWKHRRASPCEQYNTSIFWAALLFLSGAVFPLDSVRIVLQSHCATLVYYVNKKGNVCWHDHRVANYLSIGNQKPRTLQQWEPHKRRWGQDHV